MKLFKRLAYLIIAGDAVDVLIKKEKDKMDEQKRENNRHRLDLCYKHRQEKNHSHYSSQNCDHCKVLAELEECKKA